MKIEYTSLDKKFKYIFELLNNNSNPFLGIRTYDDYGSLGTGVPIKDNKIDINNFTRNFLHLSEDAIIYINRCLKLKAFW